MSYNERKLPIGIQSFEKLREEGFLYVDKTEYVYKLAHSGIPYFLSRPRRFGKSLLLSTLKAYWEGKKELFAGLAIEKLEEGNDKAWQPYPIFYFDFNRGGYQEKGNLEKVLEAHLKEWEKIYGCDESEVDKDDGESEADSLLAIRFQKLLVKASDSTGKKCVVLIDEYDKPLLDIFENEQLVEYNRSVFKGFFSTLKSFDAYLQSVFITGVTKFNKVSIFSDLNQLDDITFDNAYAGICGITENELKNYFMPEIEAMADDNEMAVAECFDKMKSTYDGYCFSSKMVGVYNPYSMLRAFNKKQFGSYWFETGTPTFLLKRIKRMNFDVKHFSDGTLSITERSISDYRADNNDPVPLLYQTGYLTIKDYNRNRDSYKIGFPNDEVRYGFLENLMQEYSKDSGAGSGKDILSIDDCIEDGNLEGLKNSITALFASIPYTSENVVFEHYFQTVLYILFELLGKYTVCELHTYTGRVDCVVETDKYVYIFEFKRDKSADEALAQIDDMNYALPYAADKRTLYKVGVNFDSETRMLTEWKVK